MQTVTFKAAQKIYETQELDSCPIPAINNKGKIVLQKFLDIHVDKDKQDIDQFCAEAELDAVYLLSSTPISVQIRRADARDNSIHTLVLSPTYFDWVV